MPRAVTWKTKRYEEEREEDEEPNLVQGNQGNLVQANEVEVEVQGQSERINMTGGFFSFFLSGERF